MKQDNEIIKLIEASEIIKKEVGIEYNNLIKNYVTDDNENKNPKMLHTIRFRKWAHHKVTMGEVKRFINEAKPKI